MRRLLLVSLVGCGGAAPTPVPAPATPEPAESPASVGTASPASDAAAASGAERLAPARTRTWKAGSGIDGCRLGDLVERCEKRIGPFDHSHDWLTVESIGVLIDFENDRVKRLDITYLRDPGSETDTMAPFPGTDSSGIGATSTSDDVRRVYGDSPEVSERGPERHGRWPGTTLRILTYRKAGVTFFFTDGALGLVQLSRPAR